MTFVDWHCFAATCRDNQQLLTCPWDVDTAMFNAKAGRSLADARDNENQPSSMIAATAREITQVLALNKNHVIENNILYKL